MAKRHPPNQAGRPSKIRSSGHEDTVRRLAAEGKGYKEIAEHLNGLGVECSYGAVGRFLNEETDERREAARSVAAAEAQKSVPLVTGVLRKWIGFVDKLIVEAVEEASPRAADDVSKLVNAGTKAAKTLHDITVGENPSDSMSALRDEALKILEAKRKREAGRGE
jgi:sugar phosphate isomerase/epimerase